MTVDLDQRALPYAVLAGNRGEGGVAGTGRVGRAGVGRAGVGRVGGGLFGVLDAAGHEYRADGDDHNHEDHKHVLRVHLCTPSLENMRLTMLGDLRNAV